MPSMFERDCAHCGVHYRGIGRTFCSLRCRVAAVALNGTKSGLPLERQPVLAGLPPKSCSRCNIAKPIADFCRRGTGAQCKACSNQTMGRWRGLHREVGRLWSKNNYRANKAKVDAESRAYHEANPQKIKELSKAYAANNKELLAEKNRAWYDQNRDRALADAKKWRDANPEKKRISVNRRRVKKMNAEGHHAVADIKALVEMQHGLCPYCGTDLTLSYTVDHVMPISRGGTDWPHNLQLLCRSCNSKKGRKLPEEWAAVLKAKKGQPNPTPAEPDSRPAT